MTVNKVRNWLILFRSHTAMLEAPIAAMGAAVALGQVFTVEVIYWALFGVLYHFTGYGLNSYVDWKKGYDKDDPFKQHHPLNQGSLDPHTVRVVLYCLLVFTFVYGAILAWPSTLALIAISVMVVCGMVYNYWGKEISYKFIPITIAHSLIFAVPYLTYGSVDLILVAAFAALIFHHTFQILISGDIKDITQDESSLLDRIGIKYEEVEDYSNGIIVTSLLASVIVISLSLLQAASTYTIIGYMSLTEEKWMLSVIVSSIFFLATFRESSKVVESGKYVRPDRISHMSHREIVGYWGIYGAFIPIIGHVEFWLMFSLTLIYLFAMSRFLWGTFIQPQV